MEFCHKSFGGAITYYVKRIVHFYEFRLFLII